jgi:hypothetical protein
MMQWQRRIFCDTCVCADMCVFECVCETVWVTFVWNSSAFLFCSKYSVCLCVSVSIKTRGFCGGGKCIYNCLLLINVISIYIYSTVVGNIWHLLRLAANVYVLHFLPTACFVFCLVFVCLFVSVKQCCILQFTHRFLYILKGTLQFEMFSLLWKSKLNIHYCL